MSPTASSTACISASTSRGTFSVLVSSGAATAASTFNGPGKPAGAGSTSSGTGVSPSPRAAADRRYTLTPGSSPRGPTSPPASVVRRSSSAGKNNSGPDALSTTSMVSPGGSRSTTAASTRCAAASNSTPANRRPASAIRSAAASVGSRSAPHTPFTSAGNGACPRHSSDPPSHTAEATSPSPDTPASISTSVRSAGRASPATWPVSRGGKAGTMPRSGSTSRGCPVSTRNSASAPTAVYSVTR